MGGCDPAYSLVCILKPDRSPEGVGFLVQSRFVITCAHVYDWAQEDGRVTLTFPVVDSARIFSARIIARYDDAIPAEINDVAILEIMEPLPRNTKSLLLSSLENGELSGLDVEMYGFPKDFSQKREDGTIFDRDQWVKGIVRRSVSGGRIQIDHTPGTQTVKKGFSGSPVWDAESHSVVGMASDIWEQRKDEVTAAYMIPAVALQKAMQQNRPSTGPPPLVCYRINRNNQIAQLRRMVKPGGDRFKSQKGVVVCVLHGDEDQCHKRFLECFEKHYWRNDIARLRADQPDPLRIDMYWPKCRWETFEDIKADVVLGLSNKINIEASKIFEDVSEALNRKTSDRAVLVHTRITSEDEGWREIIDHFLAFWRSWPERRVETPLIACLEVLYLKPVKDLKRSGWFRWPFRRKSDPLVIRDAICKSLSGQYARNLLPELEDVTRTHAMNWAEEPDVCRTVQCVCERSGMGGREMLRHLFEENKKYIGKRGGMPMEKLARLLAERFFTP